MTFSNMELALDEIIKKQKVANKRPNERLGDRGIRRARPRYQDLDQPVHERVPEGRWKHDKYEELYGGRRLPKRGGGTTSRSEKSDIVKLNIANLAESVDKYDLQELLAPYPVMGLAVHYDERGYHLGTADVFVKRRGAKKIIEDFRKVALDGRELKFFIVDESNAKVSAKVTGRLTRVGSKPVRERTIKRRSDVPSSSSSRSHLAKKSRPLGKLNVEDLDRELDEYMKTSGHKRITID